MVKVEMKLFSTLNNRINGKEYRKWQVVLPPNLVRELEWHEGAELHYEVVRGSLVLAHNHKK